MKKLRKFLSRFRLVYRRSSTLTKCVVLATLVLTTLAVVVTTAATKSHQRQEELYRQQAAALIQENQDLRDKISILGTVDSIKSIAEEMLGLVDPDTIIYDIEEK